MAHQKIVRVAIFPVICQIPATGWTLVLSNVVSVLLGGYLKPHVTEKHSGFRPCFLQYKILQLIEVGAYILDICSIELQ